MRRLARARWINWLRLLVDCVEGGAKRQLHVNRSRIRKRWHFFSESRRLGLPRGDKRAAGGRGWMAGLSARCSSDWIRRPICRTAPTSESCWCIAPFFAAHGRRRRPLMGAGGGRSQAARPLASSCSIRLPGEKRPPPLPCARGWTETGLCFRTMRCFPTGRLCDYRDHVEAAGRVNDEDPDRHSGGDAKASNPEISRLSPDVQLHI